jgi:hypothetical protein
VGDELVGGDCATQLVLHAQALGGPAAHDLVEQLEAPAAGVLGLVHRGVRLPDEVLRAVREAGGDGDAAAGRDEVLAGGEPEGAAQLVERAARDEDRFRGIAEVVADHAELVAAEPCDRVARAQRARQPLAQCAQQLVARVMAAAVVDELELVEVEEQDGDRRLAPCAVLDGLGETVDEQRAVGKAREGILHGLTAHLVLRAAAVDRVGEHVGGRLEVGQLVERELAARTTVDAQVAERGFVGPDRHVGTPSSRAPMAKPAVSRVVTQGASLRLRSAQLRGSKPSSESCESVRESPASGCSVPMNMLATMNHTAAALAPPASSGAKVGPSVFRSRRPSPRRRPCPAR